MKRFDVWIVIFLVLAVMAACTACVGPVALSRFRRPAISEVTTPLPPEVVSDICHKFEVREDDWRCRADAKVYAPDFFPLIRSAFQPESSTYDDVQAKLGIYQYHCESLIIEANGNKYYTCDYDLHDDRVFPIGIFFKDDNTVWRIFATIGDD